MVGQEKCKVMYLITKSNWGGAQKYVYDLATRLPDDRFEVLVVLGGTGELYERLVQRTIRTIPLRTLRRDIGLFTELQSAWQLFRIIRRERPDVLHLNSSKAGAIGGMVGRLCGIKRIIFTAHGWAFNEDRPTWQKKCIAFLHWLTLLFAHQSIAVSYMIQTQAPHFLGTASRMIVIHNGIAPVHYLAKDAARAALAKNHSLMSDVLKRQPDTLVVGTIGELHPIKGQRDLITAYATIRDNAPHSILIIIGEGEMRARLENHIKNLALERCVFLIGHMSDAAVYLRAFDLFVLASHSEALSLAALEAGLAGLPVIATRVGGIPEIITSDTEGVLVPARNTHALGIAIDHMLKQPQQRIILGRTLEKRIHDAFSLEDMVDKTIACYAPKNSLSASSRGTVRA